MKHNQELAIIISAKNAADQAFKMAEKQISTLGGATTAYFRAAGEESKKFAGTMAKLGAVLGAGLGFAGKEFVEFEKSMSQVKAIMDPTEEQFKDLTDLAQKMGRETAFTASQAADSLRFLGMAGFSAEDAMLALEGTMSLAAASGMELGRSADIASNVLTGFRLEAKETDRVVDVLAKTITTSNTDLEQLGQAMKYFAPTAAAFGVSLEEASATVGLLGNAGIQSSLATRALGTSIANLAKEPTAMAQASFIEMNKAAFDTKGNFVGMAKLIDTLSKKLEGMTDKQKQAYIVGAFGAEAIQEINVLLAVGSEEMERYTRVLEDANGAAREMAQTQLDNVAGSYTLMKSALSGYLIELGSRFGPAMRSALGAVTDFFLEITNQIPTLEQLEVWMKQNEGTIRIVAGAIAGALTPAVIGLALAFGRMMLALGPFVTIGILVAQNFEKIAEFVKGLGINLGDLTGAWETMKAVAVTHMEHMKQVIGAVAEFFKAEILPLFEEFFKTIEFWVVVLKELWDTNFLHIQDITTIVWEGIKGFIAGAWEFISNLITAGLAFLRGDWETVWNSMKNALTPIVSGIRNIIFVFWEGLKAIFKSGGELLSAAWGNMWEGMKNTAIGIWEAVKQSMKDGINWMIEKINWLIDKVNSLADSVPGVKKNLIPKIPLLAEGGIVTQPTLAMIGEAGPEAVVPLSRAGSVNIGRGEGGSGITIINQIAGNFIKESDLVDLISEQLAERLNLRGAIIQ